MNPMYSVEERNTLWDNRSRTYDTRYQKPLPYLLATSHLFSSRSIFLCFMIEEDLHFKN